MSLPTLLTSCAATRADPPRLEAKNGRFGLLAPCCAICTGSTGTIRREVSDSEISGLGATAGGSDLMGVADNRFCFETTHSPCLPSGGRSVAQKLRRASPLREDCLAACEVHMPKLGVHGRASRKRADGWDAAVSTGGREVGLAGEVARFPGPWQARWLQGLPRTPRRSSAATRGSNGIRGIGRPEATKVGQRPPPALATSDGDGRPRTRGGDPGALRKPAARSARRV